MADRRAGVTVSAGLLSVGRLSATGISFLWLLLAARRLGPADFGRLSTLLALAAIFGVVHQAGYIHALTTYVARSPHEIGAASELVLRRRVVLAFVAAVPVVVLYARMFPGRHVEALVFVGSIVATSAYTTVNAAWRGVRIVWPDIANEIASRVAVAVLGLSLIFFADAGVTGAVIAYSTGDVLSAVVLVIALRRWVRRHTQSPLSQRAAFGIRAVAPLGAAVAITAVSFRVDAWMVAAMKGDEEAGIYGAAFRLMEGLLIPAGVLGMMGFAGLATATGRALRQLLVKLGAGALAVTALGSAIIATFADLLIENTFGASFLRAVDPLRWLVLAAIPTAVIYSVTPALASQARSRFLIVALIGGVANIVLNLVLIPRYGASGAAMSTFVTQSLLLAVAVAVLRNLISGQLARRQS